METTVNLYLSSAYNVGGCKKPNFCCDIKRKSKSYVTIIVNAAYLILNITIILPDIIRSNRHTKSRQCGKMRLQSR